MYFFYTSAIHYNEEEDRNPIELEFEVLFCFSTIFFYTLNN